MDYLDNGFKVVRVVITGGPCSGKTTAMKRVFEELKDTGYQILIMPETATQLIGGGIAPWTCRNMESYQKWQMIMQMEKEKVYAGAAEEISEVNQKPILIIYDRGMLDNKAYMSQEAFTKNMEALGVDEDESLSWYDIVFHLETAAKGAVEAYTCDNNSARTETAEEAIQLDNRSLMAWKDHPNRVIIDNSTGFEEKMDRLFGGIRDFLQKDEIKAD